MGVHLPYIYLIISWGSLLPTGDANARGIGSQVYLSHLGYSSTIIGFYLFPFLLYKKENSAVSKAVSIKELKEVKRNSNKILVSFNPEDKELQEKAVLKLNKIVRIMNLNKNQRLELTAYSSEGSASKARRMSLMRALTIRSFLIKRGISSNKLNVKALGNNTVMGPVDRVDIILLN